MAMNKENLEPVMNEGDRWKNINNLKRLFKEGFISEKDYKVYLRTYHLPYFVSRIFFAHLPKIINRP